MHSTGKNILVVLGTTASGKTKLGVQLAHAHGGEVVSADSRQVYRGLDIGSGKDLDEYKVGETAVPYHMIDVVNLSHEFSVFEYQQRFFETLDSLRTRNTLPVVVGGTGLYLESILNGYRMVDTPECPDLRAKLATLPHETLVELLRSQKGKLHNVTETRDRERLVRAIEIAEYAKTHEPEPAPRIDPLILGTRWDRAELHERIMRRLRERLDEGMIEEVRGLLDSGVSTDTLRFLGLEYRFVTDFLEGAIKNENDLFQKLNGGIRNFAKRQETWFRRMERHGAQIHWINKGDIVEALGRTGQWFPLAKGEPGMHE